MTTIRAQTSTNVNGAEWAVGAVPGVYGLGPRGCVGLSSLSWPHRHGLVQVANEARQETMIMSVIGNHPRGAWDRFKAS